jgi:hypothetical protein
VLKINFKMNHEPLTPETIEKVIDQQKKEKEFWDAMKMV